jgi:hypothetical protein
MSAHHEGGGARDRGQAEAISRQSLFADFELDIVGKDHGHGALGRVFRSLVGMMAPPYLDARTIAFDRWTASFAGGAESR